MELAGLEVALGESGSEWRVDVKASDTTLLYTAHQHDCKHENFIALQRSSDYNSTGRWEFFSSSLFICGT